MWRNTLADVLRRWADRLVPKNSDACLHVVGANDKGLVARMHAQFIEAPTQANILERAQQSLAKMPMTRENFMEFEDGPPTQTYEEFMRRTDKDVRALVKALLKKETDNPSLRLRQVSLLHAIAMHVDPRFVELTAFVEESGYMMDYEGHVNEFNIVRQHLERAAREGHMIKDLSRENVMYGLVITIMPYYDRTKPYDF